MRRALAFLFIVPAIFALVVHFTVRDSVDALAPLFYAIPLPVAGAALLAGAIFARRFRRIVAVAGIVVLGGWLAMDYGFASPKKGTWKFITWNVQDAKHPAPLLLKLVRTEWPDFVAILEAGPITPALVEMYERALPGYRMVPLGGDRACLMRGAVASVNEAALGGRTRVITVRMLLRGEWMRVIVVDLDSGIFLSRRAALERIAVIAGQAPRTVVLGDFNTPLESAHLTELRRNFTVAIEGPHAGFRETWPYGAPLLSLDQIWLSRDLRPIFARRVFTLASDHSPVIASFGPR